MARFIAFLLRTRIWWLLLIAALTAATAWSVSNGRVATSVGALLLGESGDYIRYRDLRVPQFGSDAQVVFGFEAGDLLSKERVEALGRAIEQIKLIPEVVRVDSVLNAVHLRSAGTAVLEVGEYGDEALARPEGAQALAEELRQDPLASGYLVSSDGKDTAMVVEIEFDDERPSEDMPEVLDNIAGVLKEHGFGKERLHFAGMPAVLGEIMDMTMVSVTKQLPLAAGLLLLIVFLMFGRLWPVVICAAVGGLASLWTMGVAVAYDRNISVLLAMAPSVITTVACSDVIHLCSAYLLELAHGEPKREAILKAGAEVGRASAFTSLTALAGFVSLALVPTPVFRELGLVLGIGVCSALLLSLTLGPILFSLMPVPKPWTAPRTLGAASTKVLDGVLGRIEHLSRTKPWHVVTVFAFLAAWSVWGIVELRIDTDLSARLPADNPLRVSQAYFQEKFRGTNSVEVFVDAPPGRDMLDPELLSRAAKLEAELEALPGPTRVLSFADVIKEMHRHLGSSGAAQLPGTREGAAQLLLLLESSGTDAGIERLIDFDRRSLRLLVSLPEQGVRQTYEFGARAVEMAKPLTELGATVEVGGSNYLAGQWLDNILWGQAKGLFASLLVVMIMMMIALKSVRMGAWAMVPNVLPLMALGGFVGFAWPGVDSDIFAVAMMADGIAVDDTIHFLTRYRVECSKTTDRNEAMRRAYHFSGRAVIITALVLVAGFAPFALSNYLPIYLLGLMMPYTLFLALICELFLVPAMVKLGVLRVSQNAR